MTDPKTPARYDRTSFERESAWTTGRKTIFAKRGPYRNTFTTVSVDERSDAAVVVTRDTGSNRVRSWKDEQVMWFLGKSAGKGRIVGMIIRDIQF